jgi:hypothetical protein
VDAGKRTLQFKAICLPQKSSLENHPKSLSDIASVANLRINNVSRGSLAPCSRPTRAPLSLSEAGEGNPYCESVASGLTSRIPYSQLELGRVRGVEKTAVLYRGCSRMRQPKPFARLGSPCQRSEPYWGRGRGSSSGYFCASTMELGLRGVEPHIARIDKIYPLQDRECNSRSRWKNSHTPT